MREECRRIISGRLLWLLFGGVMVINMWILWNFRDQREYVEISRTLAERGIVYVTEENAEEIIRSFAEAEERMPGEAAVRNLVEGTLRLAEQLTASDLADAYISSMKLEDQAAEYARKIYGTLEPVLEKNREEGTARQFFGPCGGRFFEMFSARLSLAFTLESVLGAVLLMMKYVNEPFDRRTGAVVYAARMGRKVNMVKGRAVLAVAAGFTAAVWGFGMGMAAILFPMGSMFLKGASLWKTELGSMMVLDNFCPLITRFSVSIGEYMALQFLVNLCVTLLLGGLAYLAVIRRHKAFTAFGTMAFVCFGTAVLTRTIPRDRILYFILRFNLVDFAAKSGHWFASGGTFLSARGYEVVFIVFWSAVTLGLCCRQNRRFLREDL